MKEKGQKWVKIKKKDKIFTGRILCFSTVGVTEVESQNANSLFTQQSHMMLYVVIVAPLPLLPHSNRLRPVYKLGGNNRLKNRLS